MNANNAVGSSVGHMAVERCWCYRYPSCAQSRRNYDHRALLLLIPDIPTLWSIKPQCGQRRRDVHGAASRSGQRRPDVHAAATLRNTREALARCRTLLLLRGTPDNKRVRIHDDSSEMFDDDRKKGE